MKLLRWEPRPPADLHFVDDTAIDGTKKEKQMSIRIKISFYGKAASARPPRTETGAALVDPCAGKS
ncbi:hypothetical protein CK222_25795 [Mesorhizobium sp. WSM3866]|nr:hypothetical protein CK222_25795 [Mesorhizobium sp. WSM3866]